MIAPRLIAGLMLAGAGLSAQTARHAVLIDIDGLRADVFAKTYEEGRLPNFARIFSNALWFDNASTVTPSVTMAGQASIVTGTPPSRHGIVGNQWFDREQRKLIDYMNANGISCVYGFTLLGGPSCATGLGNRHLQARTIYEAAASAGLTSLAVYNQYWTGASRPAAPTSAEAAVFLRNNTLDYRTLDSKMATRAAAELKAAGALPAVLTIYFAGADGLAHKQGIAAQAPYLATVIDPLLGYVLDAIEAVDPQWAGSTMFVLTSDHGRTDVTPHPEDQRLLADLNMALPAGARIAVNGGVGYIYSAPAELAPVLESDPKLSPAIASVRARTADDPARAGDLIVTLRQGHYFKNPGVGSHHGSVYGEDVAVPLVLAAPGVSGRHIGAAVKITQIARTIADYVGFAMEWADPPLPLSQGSKTASRR